MKKRVIAAAAAFITLAVLLSACGGTPAAPTPTPSTAPGASPEVSPEVPPITTSVPAPPTVEPSVKLPTVEPVPVSPTPVPTPAQTPEPTFPVSEIDPVFDTKLQELTRDYPLGIRYSIFDVDGDGEDELVVKILDIQFNSLRVFEKAGDECVFSLRGDWLYIGGEGRLVAHTGFISDGCYHLYTVASPENPVLEYRSSLGIVKVSSEDSVYYYIDDRTESYIDISSYYDGRYNEQLIIYEWGNSSSPIDLSPYLIEESEYLSLLDELLSGCTEFDIRLR